MANVAISYSAAAAAALTITLASLANGSAQQSAMVDNSTNKYADALLGGKVKLNGVAASDKTVYVFIYGSHEATTPTYPGGATGSDAAYTMEVNSNLMLLGAIACNDNATCVMEPKSVAACFGGIMPQKWGIIVQNKSGVPLTATAGDHGFSYVGITPTVT